MGGCRYSRSDRCWRRSDGAVVVDVLVVVVVGGDRPVRCLSIVVVADGDRTVR